MRAIIYGCLIAAGIIFAYTSYIDATSRPVRHMNTPLKDPSDSTPAPDNASTITLGAGCFWCVEAVFLQLEGVYTVTSGYMGGHVKNPTYEEVCEKKTGHVEVVQIKYDTSRISTETLLGWFWELHDPTQADGQGADIGPQYASTIFYHSEEQKKIAQESSKTIQPTFDKPIVTALLQAETFYPAENYHQNYYFQNKNKNSYCRMVITPKLTKLRLKK